MSFLSDAVLVTLAAQILTLPLIVAYFHQLSLVSLAANLFILPAQPGVMAWGGLATLTGLVSPFIGQLLAWVAWLFLSWTVLLVRFFAAIPGATTAVTVSPFFIIGLYGCIFAATWFSRQQAERRQVVWLRVRTDFPQWTALGLGGAAAMLLLLWGVNRPDGNLHVVFLDVGQGDAIFIQTPSGRQIVVDGGRYPTVLNQYLGEQIPFWDREIDLLIATHPEADHISGLPGIFDRYRVGRLITNGEIKDSVIFDALEEAAAGQGTPVIPVTAGSTRSTPGFARTGPPACWLPVLGVLAVTSATKPGPGNIRHCSGAGR
jgi:competence protein ComEC